MTSSFLLNTVGNQGIETIRTAALEGKGQDKIGGTFERLWDRIADFFTGSNRVAAKENLYTLFSPEASSAQKYDAFFQLKSLAKSGYEQDFEVYTNFSDNEAVLKVNLGFGDIQEFHLSKLPIVDYMTLATLGFDENFHIAQEHMAKLLSSDSAPPEKMDALYCLYNIAKSVGKEENFQIQQHTEPGSSTQFNGTIHLTILSGTEELFKSSHSKSDLISETLEVEIDHENLEKEVRLDLNSVHHLKKSTGKANIPQVEKQAEPGSEKEIQLDTTEEPGETKESKAIADIIRSFERDIDRSGVEVHGEMTKSTEDFERLMKEKGYDADTIFLAKTAFSQRMDFNFVAHGIKDSPISPDHQAPKHYSIDKVGDKIILEIKNEWDIADSYYPLRNLIELKSVYLSQLQEEGDPIPIPKGSYHATIELSKGNDPKVNVKYELTRYALPRNYNENAHKEYVATPAIEPSSAVAPDPATLLNPSSKS